MNAASLSTSRSWRHWLVRISRFISRFVICLGALLVLLFLFETWRGSSAWHRFVADSKTVGENFEPASVIPPLILDEDNFAMIPLLRPLFQYTRSKDGSVIMHDTNGIRTLRRIYLFQSVYEVPKLPDWRNGKQVDLTAWQNFYRKETNYPSPQNRVSAGADILFALGKFDTEMNELRDASKRSGSRFPIKYEEHDNMVLEHLSVLRRLTLLSKMRVLAELSLNKTDEALADLLLALRLCESITDEPLLLSQLVRIAQLEITIQPLWEGLVRHQWREVQLASLDAKFAEINLVTSYKRAMRGERNLFIFGAFDAIQEKRGWLHDFRWGGSGNLSYWEDRSLKNVPKFYVDHSKVVIGRMFDELLKDVSADRRRLSRTHAVEVERQIREIKESLWRRPYSILAAIEMDPLTRAVEKFGRTQGTIDLARTAIALERHRLKHSSYPVTLETIDPALKPVGDLPRDVITGEPLRYARTAKERFQLYAVGWNGTDEGGLVVWNDTEKTEIDFTKGDWVWPQPAD